MAYKKVSGKNFSCTILFTNLKIIMLMTANKGTNIIRMPLSWSCSRERNIFILKEEPVYARNVRKQLADYSISRDSVSRSYFIDCDMRKLTLRTPVAAVKNLT